MDFLDNTFLIVPWVSFFWACLRATDVTHDARYRMEQERE